MSFKSICLSTLSIFALAACGRDTPPSENNPADIIVFGGPIYTALHADPMIEAVAVDDGKIVGVGAFADLLTQYGDGAQQLNLNGAALSRALQMRMRTF